MHSEKDSEQSITPSLQKLVEAKNGKSQLLCMEINPPRGTDVGAVFARLEGKVGWIDYFNVTDSALAKMKCAALPFASLIKQQFGIEPLVNVSCRDRNLIALQGDLLAAWLLGVRAIVALTGDAVTVGDMPESKGVFEVNSVGLLKVIEKLNHGEDSAQVRLKGKPLYTCGAVVNPNVKNPSAEIRRLQKKKDAGALFALSQPVFEEESARRFFEEAAQLDMPILAGLLPFKSAKALEGIRQVPGIKLSPELDEIAQNGTTEDLSERSLDLCLSLVKPLSPYVAGFHIIAGGTPLLGLELGKRVKEFLS